VPRPSTTTITYCKLHARYACQSMSNEALANCEPGPPYLLTCNGKKRCVGGGGVCQHTQYVRRVRGERSAYTRKRTGYLVRPESSMRGGRSSIAFNSERG
jgi:hypothetical protein